MNDVDAAASAEDIQELDTCGLLCPLPVLKTRKRLGTIAPGGRLRVLADDPAALVDIPHFCIEQGHMLEDQAERPGGVLTFTIVRGA